MHRAQGYELFDFVHSHWINRNRPRFSLSKEVVYLGNYEQTVLLISLPPRACCLTCASWACGLSHLISSAAENRQFCGAHLSVLRLRACHGVVQLPTAYKSWTSPCNQELLLVQRPGPKPSGGTWNRSSQQCQISCLYSDVHRAVISVHAWRVLIATLTTVRPGSGHAHGLSLVEPARGASTSYFEKSCHLWGLPIFHMLT